MKSAYVGVLILGLCLAAGVIIAGCTQTSSPAPVQTATPVATAAPQASPAATANMPNPASVNCVENLNGTLQIMNGPNGQYGMCTLPNGTTCEEWALFRGEGCQPGVSANETPATAPANVTGMANMPNPASVNCVNLNGTLRIVNGANGQYGMCDFPNGTSCEEWALFRGEGCQPGVSANVTS